jgi:hypothetical protein
MIAVEVPDRFGREKWQWIGNKRARAFSEVRESHPS